MTKEELEKEAIKRVDAFIDTLSQDVRSTLYNRLNQEDIKDFLYGVYIDSAEPREKHIAELEEANKANEWHYVKDGLPSEDGRYLVCNIFSNNYVATNIAEFNSKNGIFGCIDNSTIYAWKEIVLPELKESE